MGFFSRIKSFGTKLKTKILGSTSRADFIAGRTNEAHYYDKDGREWFLFRDAKNPSETAYRVEKNGKVIKEGHTLNINALDSTGLPQKLEPKPTPPATPKAPEIIARRIEREGKIRVQKTGQQLQRSMLAFGHKYSIDYKLRQKISAMKWENLEELYVKGEILFTAYFDYHTLEEGPYGLYAGETKNMEVQELVSAYEDRFGAL
jgi:hypothetical protein